MKKLIIILSIVIVYGLSAWYSWNWFHIAYSKEGIWGRIDADTFAVILTLCPALNTVNAIYFLHISPYSAKNNQIQYNRFFNVSK